jgi:outer membrane protein assembly factor BamD
MTNLLRHRILLVIAGISTALMLHACSSAEGAGAKKSVDDIYSAGKKSFDDGNYLDAQSQFDVIKLQYPASQYADDAQYYTAEINFERGEYIMAAFNYNQVRRSYPSSEFVREAMFKAAQCYEKIALPADRDQENTRKAIQAYTDFQALFVRDSLSLEASKRIRELRDRLAERFWLIADHYLLTLSRKAAMIQLDAIVDEYPDTKWFEPALVKKIELLTELERIDEARTAISTYRRTVKQPQQQAVVDAIERGLR